MIAIRIGTYAYFILVRLELERLDGLDAIIVCMYICIPNPASYLEELVHVYRSAAVEVHEVQCMLDLRQLTIGMQRLIQNRTAVPELFPRDHLQHQDVHVDIKVINMAI